MGSSNPDKILIRSIDRTSGTSANFTLQMRHNLQEGFYSLDFLQCPNTFYNVASGINNIIPLYENSTQKSTTIPPGSYTGTALATALASALNSASGGFNTYTVTFNTAQMTFTFTASSGNFTFQYGTQASIAARNNAQLLGFTRTADTTAGTSLTSDGVVDLSYPTCVLIRIDQNNSIMTAATGGVNTWSGGSFIIPVDVNGSGIAYYYPGTYFKQRCFIRATSNPVIQLVDLQGNVMSLQGSEWDFLLSKVTA